MNKNTFIVGLTVAAAFVTGGILMWMYQERQLPDVQPVISEDLLDDMFDDGFFSSSRDPFQEMDRMRERMDKLFHDDRFSRPFDSWFDHRFGSASAGSITMDEDEDVVTYRINIGDRDLVDLQVDVEAGYLSIQGKVEDRAGSSVAMSQFSQRFPLPADVDAASTRVEQRDETVVVTLQKVAG